ncbi:hypothetical protein [Sphingobacterium anhuiense]|uniref:hypothetical protein n=1 Tax=Sphingobacterium anhuiense TaxID=493780 RepID=UPI003C2C4E14
MMDVKDFRYFFFFQFLILQGVLIWILFDRSLEIEGDIGVYLNMIAGTRDMDNIEPASYLIFTLIGFLPTDVHFSVLYSLVFGLSIIESWIVFKNTNGSLIWMLFFSLAIVPFFHAINLRTGFGMFILFLTFRSNLSLIATSFFHSSFIPLIIGFRLKLSIKQLLFIGSVATLIGITLYVLVSDKFNAYMGYYAPEDSVFGVTVEIFWILTFSFILMNKYQINSKILWYRIFYSLIFISLISLNVAIISSRFVTMSYLLLLIIAMNSDKRISDLKVSVLDILFYLFLAGLILFRLYRIITMFGLF